MAGMKLTEHDIIDALTRFFSAAHICFPEVKDGSTYGRRYLRMDFVAIKKTWSPVTIVVSEIKTSRSDFLKDNKWPEYMKMCTKFFWVCPTGLIKKDEIDKTCGLIYVNPDTKKARTVKAAIHRAIDPDPYMLLYLLLWREHGISNRNTRDDKQRKMRELLRDMKKRHDFGKSYAYFNGKKLHEAHTRVVVAEEKMKLLQQELDGMKGLKKFVEESGLQLATIAKSHVLDDLWKLSRLVKVRGQIEQSRDELARIVEALPKDADE